MNTRLGWPGQLGSYEQALSVLVWYLIVIQVFGCSILSGCDAPLGLQSGKVVDSQLSGSDYHRHFFLGPGKSADLPPWQARLNNSLAWCSSYTGEQPFLMVDFSGVVNISGIAMQGLEGVRQYYVTSYKIVYGTDGKQWHQFNQTDTNEEKVRMQWLFIVHCSTVSQSSFEWKHVIRDQIFCLALNEWMFAPLLLNFVVAKQYLSVIFVGRRSQQVFWNEGRSILTFMHMCQDFSPCRDHLSHTVRRVGILNLNGFWTTSTCHHEEILTYTSLAQTPSIMYYFLLFLH